MIITYQYIYRLQISVNYPIIIFGKKGSIFAAGK